MKREIFTQHLFDDMVALYKTGSISQMCLTLQRDFDADVPVFLICVMADRANLTLPDAEFIDWVATARQWREAVIIPLRQVRVVLKDQQEKEGVTSFRERIKSVELEAEKLHIDALGQAFLKAEHNANSPANLAERYMQMIGVSSSQSSSFLASFEYKMGT